MECHRVKVSIIVPVYNVEKYLRRCMDSLISQTLGDIEIIAINDGSTDGSLKILEEYRDKDERVKIIDKKNTGVSDSRNQGIDISKGEYILFVDSDDWIDVDMAMCMYNKAKENNCDVVMCSYIREFEKHSKIKEFNLPYEVTYEKDEILKLNRRIIGPIDEELGNAEGLDSLGTIWGKLYNSNIIKKNNIKFIDLKEIGSAEDSLFNIFLFKHVKKAIFINEALYHYWKANEKSLTSGYNPSLRIQWHNLFNYIKEFINENNLDDSFKKALDNRICMCVLGLGINECSKANSLSTKYKIRNIRYILEDSLIRESYKKFDISNFPIHWRLFYYFNKKKFAFPSFYMLNTIQYLRMRI